MVDATSIHKGVCNLPDSIAATTHMDLDNHTLSLAGHTKNVSCDHYQAMIDNNDLVIATDFCEKEVSSTRLGNLLASKVQNWMIYLSERLVFSTVILSSHEYLFNSMIQVPQLLPSLNTGALMQISLKLSFDEIHIYVLGGTIQRKRLHGKTVYVLREDIGLVAKFISFPLDKAKYRYVAADKVTDLIQGQCCGHPKVLDTHAIFHSYYKITVYNVEQTMHLSYCDSHQSFEYQTKVGSGFARAECSTVGNRNQMKYVTKPLLAYSRPAGKSVYACEVAVPESHRGPSELELPKEWNTFNALFKNTKFSSIQVLCLKSKEVVVGATMRPKRQKQMCSHDHAQQLHRKMGHFNAQHEFQNRMRGETFMEGYKIQVVDLTFSAREIIQLLRTSHYDEIIQQLQNIPTNLPPESLIPTHFIIGVAYFKTSNYIKAREHFKKCAAIAEEAHRGGDVMLCNAYLGDMEYASQSYLEAIKYYKKAVDYYTSGNVALIFKLTPPSVSAIHAKLASAFRNVSMTVQAIQHYQEAISKAKSHWDELSAHTSLGNLYQSIGDSINAVRKYKGSIKLAEVLCDHISLGWAHGNIGNAYLGLRKKGEALYHLQKSLDFAIEYERSPQAIGRAYNNLGSVYESMNDFDKAEEYYDLALNQAIKNNDVTRQAQVFGNIGNVHMLRKNYKRAISDYGKVLDLSNDPAIVRTALHNRGCAYYDWATSLQQRGDNALMIHSPKCDVSKCLESLSPESKELYRKGTNDLEKVVEYYEERLQHLKNSASGLTTSISSFESNSHTFHCLQNCLFNLHKFDKALLVAEQNRARTLGELLLKRKGKNFKSPLKFDQVTDIIKNLSSPLIYFSYTGERLICWVILPNSDQIAMHTFDRTLSDDQFDGKSFDCYLCYSLMETLVEHSSEMYKHIKYDSESSDKVRKLYNLVCKPIRSVIDSNNTGFLQLTVVSDVYTALLPLTCLQDPQTTLFFSDHYYFNSIPSLLILDIMNQSQAADLTVYLEDVRNDVCIVGDPNIPLFKYNNELHTLGKLPYARREAQWVAHALKVTPILSEHATKNAVLSRLQGAKIVHLATHGSASDGFLAFAAFALHTNAKSNTVDSSNVLLHLEEAEKLHISPALVVLSSCDSGRGTVKADSIQGMARAFILAGAQSVLTTLWKVPDESASVFMQFFYQYLLQVDNIQSSLALQKAILSIRCFAKYSQYIHWSGYQLTGRNIRLMNKPKPLFIIIQNRLGKPSIFLRLSDVMKLEKMIEDAALPTDVQVLLQTK